VTATIFTLDPSMPNGVTKMVAVTFFLVQFAVKRRGRERRPVHREEVPLGAIYRFGRHLEPEDAGDLAIVGEFVRVAP